MAKKTQVAVDGRQLQLSNLDKIFYPEVGFTKAQVIDYYARIAPALLPHLKDRPVSLKRYPDGVTGAYFFEKQAPSHRPKWIETTPVESEDRRIDYCLINDLPALVWASNLANLELHTFLHRAPDIETPTMLAFDLDPGEGADILLCAQVGLWIRDLLEDLGVESFPKTSGSKGLQLYVPLNSPTNYDQTKAFAYALAERLESEHPEQVVSKMQKSLRVGKVFVDWSQNDEHKTTVTVYSLRAKNRPTVSTPMTWDEIGAALKKRDSERLVFESDEVLKRMEKNGDLFEPVLTLKQKLPSLDSLIQSKTRGRPSKKGKTTKARLKTYRAKRKFNSTSEPQGEQRRSEELIFVVQKHRARRLHYDLRLAMDGTLKSWAVPEGPSLDPSVKRLAVMVEDHPLEYANFEGVIPEGNYGAGEMIIWDRGIFRMKGDPLEQLMRGKMEFELDGQKLQGEFHLVKMRVAEENQWLLFKAKDQWASKEDVLRQDRSIVTGKRIEDYKNSDDLIVKHRASPEASISVLRELRPMLAKSADAAFDDSEWIFELKLDGYRALAFVDRVSARLISRTGNDLSSTYPTVIDNLVAVGVTAVLDGEIVVVDDDGVPRFELLQSYRTANRGHLIYYVFDLLFLNGRDLRDRQLIDRKETLRRILEGSETVRYVDHVDGTGIKFFELARERELEGIVAKKKSSIYLNGKRVDQWLKIKCRRVEETIICGFTESRVNPNSLGALLLGVHRGGKLRYAGLVGTGLNRASGLKAKLRNLVTPDRPFNTVPKTDTPIEWVKPEMVCSVEFQEWTKDGILRGASFLSLRIDKPAAEV
ncbi:MAG TPA: non-homologous end-joining DNA ligase [Chthoniobacterales bacterium]|nr:non-homologous end-joining DNA ligase [Chthoniobacterales bacterium]